MIDLTASTVDDRVLNILARGRFPLDDEKRCQAAIAVALGEALIEFEREQRVTGGIIDFLLPRSGIGIEVKNKGKAKDIWRQLARYAEDDRVSAGLIWFKRSPVQDGPPMRSPNCRGKIQ